MLTEEFDQILTGIVRVVHKRTEDRQDTDNATHVIVSAGKVLTAINRAMVMAVCFIESDGQSTMKGKPYNRS